MRSVYRSDSGRVALEWVRSLIHNPPQGLTALAPPERYLRFHVKR